MPSWRMVERRLAPATCRACRREVSACMAFLRSIGIRRLEEARLRHLRGFLDAETSHRPAPSSQARTIAAFANLLPLLCPERVPRARSRAALRAPKQPEALPDAVERTAAAWLRSCIADARQLRLAARLLPARDGLLALADALASFRQFPAQLVDRIGDEAAIDVDMRLDETESSAVRPLIVALRRGAERLGTDEGRS